MKIIRKFIIYNLILKMFMYSKKKEWSILSVKGLRRDWEVGLKKGVDNG